ncbi:MAG: mechanosensitive ion channel [Muribaculaceae bacterium]|nr:mechanosensitive ion channel [Bacteroides sp.]MBD5424998.1 mechanosensitive ion channel [Bacteroides sp.]MDE6228290.1 mechanosensitive ion channel [Muribaculaceae bacterium]
MNQELKLEEGMALNDFLSIVADKAVNFAIHLVVAIVVFYIGRFLVRKLNAFVQTILRKRNVDPSIATFVQSASEIVLYFVLIIAVVGILGLETSSFVALFASAGVAIGMAMSGTLQNFAGGVLILTLRPYNVGDYIEAQGFAGTVKAIQMFSTLITTADNKTIIIPNGPLSNGSVNNYSRQEERRVDWTVSLAYGTDFDKAKAAILDVLAGDERIVRTPDVFLAELADSSINFTVRAWVKAADYWPVFFSINEQIYKTLPERGLEFPFPQLDVHVQNA